MNMHHAEALAFVKEYFYELFEKHNLEALDTYFDEEYIDDDIGDPGIDQKQNAKAYLANLFKAKPAIGVEVIEVSAQNGVISAFLEWFEKEDGRKHTFRKGVALFVLRNRKILRRHTFIYYDEKK
jgi:predicted SnoaL-like aldol condensation-catalyzing enzyme